MMLGTLNNSAESTQEIPFILDKERQERLKHKLEIEKSPLHLREATEKERKDREEIIAINPNKVKVLCWAGKNRSKFVAEILNGRGYSADYAGVDGATPFDESDWEEKYDAIIVVSHNEQKQFETRVRELGSSDKLINTPVRFLNLQESSVFYLPSGQKEQELQHLADVVVKDLDVLGFVDKSKSEAE